jgi:tetratricopeptide (TPR) repeat protein
MKLAHVLVLSALSLAAQFAYASDTPEPPAPRTAAPAADKLAAARKLIDARQWSAAVAELKRVDDRSSADWNNLMGYTLRKGATPDLAASEKYYDAALRIDPHHRNTLEYSGELYLMKGDLPKAQSRLASLQSECGTGCSQYGDLKTAIDRYVANGNKYVSSGW